MKHATPAKRLGRILFALIWGAAIVGAMTDSPYWLVLAALATMALDI